VAAPVLQLRVPEDTLARINGACGEDTRSAWLLRLIDRELVGQQPAPKDTLTTSPSLTFPDGEPSPGVLCMGPGCLDRSTSRYGLRRLRLCRACAAALTGQTYQRPGAERARVLGGTAAGPARTWQYQLHNEQHHNWRADDRTRALPRS